MRFDLGRDEGDQADQRQRSEPRPPPPPRVVARELGPAEGARAAEEGEDRGGSEQVAPEDRQARGRQHAEGHERDDARRGAERPRASRRKASASSPPPAAPKRTGSRRISPEAPRDRPRHLGQAGDALQALRRVARAGERVQRIAGDDEVAQRPQQRRGGGQRPQPRVADAADPQPDEVGRREQPRLGADEAGDGRAGRGRARPPAGAGSRRAARRARARGTGRRRRRGRRSRAPADA